MYVNILNAFVFSIVAAVHQRFISFIAFTTISKLKVIYSLCGANLVLFLNISGVHIQYIVLVELSHPHAPHAYIHVLHTHSKDTMRFFA